MEIKKDYHLIGINVACPFYSPGFIAAISGKMALRDIPVLVVSTFSKDYFIIQGKDMDNAVLVLADLGIKRNWIHKELLKFKKFVRVSNG